MNPSHLLFIQILTVLIEYQAWLYGFSRRLAWYPALASPSMPCAKRPRVLVESILLPVKLSFQVGICRSGARLCRLRAALSRHAGDGLFRGARQDQRSAAAALLASGRFRCNPVIAALQAGPHIRAV